MVMEGGLASLSAKINNDFGISTLSLGNWRHHSLEDKLLEAANAGFQAIDLFDEDWAEYLRAHGQDATACWEPTEGNLKLARQLGDLVKHLGMYIICTQPLRQIEGAKDPAERNANFERVANRFPFMRAFGTDLALMCSNIRGDAGVTMDFKTIVRELRQLSDMAMDFSRRDGGGMIKIGYEALSWAQRNTWSSTWEIIRAVNRPNVGLIVDSFNWIAVEFADPYNQEGHGLLYPSLEEALDVLCSSIAAFVATVPADKIFFFQIGDAELVDPAILEPHQGPDVPKLLPWSRYHRLFPMEAELGAYLPVELVTAALVAAGYRGPLSLEVFNQSLHSKDPSVPRTHAQRGIKSLHRLTEESKRVPVFWGRIAPAC